MSSTPAEGPNERILLQRITVDPEVCHGKPCIRGLRYPAETMLELLGGGMTIDDILPITRIWSATIYWLC